jgi:hypothetical protein
VNSAVALGRQPQLLALLTDINLTEVRTHQMLLPFQFMNQRCAPPRPETSAIRGTCNPCGGLPLTIYERRLAGNSQEQRADCAPVDRLATVPTPSILIKPSFACRWRTSAIQLERREITGRSIGMDVHRTFARIAVVDNGLCRDEGRIGVRLEDLRAWAATLQPSDQVVHMHCLGRLRSPMRGGQMVVRARGC